MSKHTKGPWIRVGTEVFFPNRAGGFSLMDCPDAKANAALVAQAPIMIWLLKEAEAILENSKPITSTFIQDIRTCIKMAEDDQ